MNRSISLSVHLQTPQTGERMDWERVNGLTHSASATELERRDSSDAMLVQLAEKLRSLQIAITTDHPLTAITVDHPLTTITQVFADGQAEEGAGEKAKFGEFVQAQDCSG